LEKQQLLLIKLLNDFENNLEKIRTVLNSELAKNAVVDYHDDEEWVDVQDEQEILTDEKPHVKCQFFTEDEIDAVEAEEEVWHYDFEAKSLFVLITHFNRLPGS
jgi:hypothetical protein